MTDGRFECAASAVTESRVALRRDERGTVHVHSFGACGVDWILTPEVALSLAHDIRLELDDEVSMYEPRAMRYCYWVEADEYTVSMRRDGEDISLVLDSMDAEMLADWLEEGSRRTPSSPCSGEPSAGSSARSWRTSSPT